MAITRVAFNNTATYSGAFYLSLNPSELELNQSDLASDLDILDGASVTQEAYFDSRPFVLSWRNIHNDFSGFQSMIATLINYKNQVKYVNFGSIDYAIPTLGWVKVRIKDIKININRGGKVKYNVDLYLNREPA